MTLKFAPDLNDMVAPVKIKVGELMPLFSDGDRDKTSLAVLRRWGMIA